MDEFESPSHPEWECKYHALPESVASRPSLPPAGVTLNLPTHAEISALTAGEARTAFHEQVRAWKQGTESDVSVPAAEPSLEILGAEDIGDDDWLLAWIPTLVF